MKEASTLAWDGDIGVGQSGESSSGVDDEAPREETGGDAVESEASLPKPPERATREEGGVGGEEGQGGAKGGRGGGTVPDYRLNGFVYVCPLVSDGCTFTAKAWLQDEDD